MAPLEESPRPTKRRKTSKSTALSKLPSSPAPQPALPFSTRAFRAVKDVVLGKGPQSTQRAGGEEAFAEQTVTNGAIGGLRKSLSALEIWKMARLQNGSTRGMGISKPSSPASSTTGASTPTTRRRKRDGLQEEEKAMNGRESEGEGAQTPSGRKAKVNGSSSKGKRKRYQSEVQDEVDDEEDEDDHQLAATPQSSRRSVRMNASGPALAIESTPPGSKSNRISGNRRRKLPDGLEEEAAGNIPEEATRHKTTPRKMNRQRGSAGRPKATMPDTEESELGFRAIGTSKPTSNGVQQRPKSQLEPNEEQRGTLESVSSTPLKKRGRPPKDAANGHTINKKQAPPVGDLPDDVDAEVSIEDALHNLKEALGSVEPQDVLHFRSGILSGLTGHRRLPLINLDSEYQKVHQLVEQTVLAGEGNSMLIIGSRGCAKTTLVETVVSDLSADHDEHFHVVRLNGFIHTDDKLALREIWRQLGREMEVDDDAVTGRSNYADTLTSLLALLSHTAQEEPDTETPSIAKSVIFILDEFDLFASHPRQTLLYNLFDVAQSRNAPIAVLGLTTKIDVMESLEKRVKSRFGQRYVHLSQPRNFSAFSSICKSALIPPTIDPSSCSKGDDHTNVAAIKDLQAAWTSYVDCLFTSPPFLTHLRSIYATSKSVPSFLSSCIYPISTLSASTIPSPQSLLTPSTTLRPPDSKLHLLASLSELALSLLIAAARLDIILSTDLCNFEMVYEEYVTLASRVKMQTSASGQLAIGGGGGRVWGRTVARGEWESLVALELVLPATGGTLVGRGKGEQGRMWRADVGLEEIGGSVKMSAVMARWCREI